MSSALRFSVFLAIFLSAELWIINSVFFFQNPEIYSIGVAIDLTLGIPALFYFVILRPRRWSTIYLIPAFVFSLLIANFLIPPAFHDFLQDERRLLILIEIALVAYLLSKLPRLISTYRRARENSIYFSDAFEIAIEKLVSKNRVVRLMSIEVLLMYLAFTGWFKTYTHSNRQQIAFTYHRVSGYAAVLSVLSFILAVETVGLHLILQHWSPTLALILTALSIYSIFWLIGDFHAIRLHPVVLTNEVLHIRTGLRWRADITVKEIAEITFNPTLHKKMQGYIRASVLWPRVVIHLKHPVNVFGLFGIVKTADKIALSIDDTESFRAEVLKRIPLDPGTCSGV